MLSDVARDRRVAVDDLDADVGRPDPRVPDQPLERRGAKLIVRVPVPDGRVDLQVVDDHLKNTLHVAGIARRGEALWERCHRPVQDDGADLVD